MSDLKARPWMHLVVAALVASAFLLLPALSATHAVLMDEHHAGCPTMDMGQALCAMDSLAHLAYVKRISEAFFMLLAITAFFVVWSAAQQTTHAISLRLRRRPPRTNFLVEQFSSGILNARIP